MNNQERTKAILLRRTDYAESDKILQFITPDYGRISVIAKGVRKGKSKLAGGIELFSICDLTLVQGKSQIFTLTSARIDVFFSKIMHDYDRLQLGYECIKEVTKATESVDEAEFYELLAQSFDYINDLKIPLVLTETWFRLQLSLLLGQGLNVSTDIHNQRLSAEKTYDFNTSDMLFYKKENGRFSADHIKLLRLLITKNPRLVNHVSGINNLIEECLWISRFSNSA